MGNISYNEFIDITTSTVKPAATFGRLNGLCITLANERNYDVKNDFKEYSNAGEVLKDYGINSSAYNYASAYFSYSSKTATKPQLLTLYQWVGKDLPYTVKGGALSTEELEQIKIQGTLRTVFKDEQKDVEVNLTQAKNFVEVADKVAEALNKAYSGAGLKVVFDDATKGLVVKTKAIEEKITFLIDEVETTEIFKGTLTNNVQQSINVKINESGNFNFKAARISSDSQAGQADLKCLLNGNVEAFKKQVNNVQAHPLESVNETKARAEKTPLAITNIKLDPTGYTATDVVLSYTQAAAKDLVKLLKLAESTGATITEGLKAVHPKDLLNTIAEYNGNYVTIGFDKAADENLNVGALNAANMFSLISKAIQGYEIGRYFVVYYLSDDIIDTITEENMEVIKSLDGIVLARGNNQIVPFTQAIIASIDYAAVNGATNINFISAGEFSKVAIDTVGKLNELNKKRINTPYKVGGYGNSQTLFGEGHVMGTTFETLSVALGQVWIRAQMQVQGMNLLTNSALISLRGKQGQGKVISIFSSVLNDAVRGGIIVGGATLTPLEVSVARDASGIADIDKQLESTGWFLQVNELTEENIKNKTIPVTIIYVANLPVNRIQIKSFVIGA